MAVQVYNSTQSFIILKRTSPPNFWLIDQNPSF